MSSKLSKRQQKMSQVIEPNKVYKPDDAFEALKKVSVVKFPETVDVSVMLGVDARKSDQVVRSSVVLPNGTGKTVRVAVMVDGEKAILAKKAGADIVGLDDLAAQIKKGKHDFDLLIATPETMRVVAPLGQILGPKGLMPNPKVGTVTDDVAGAVKKAKAGQVRYRIDKAGIVHSAIGKVTHSSAELVENLKTLLNDIRKCKPANAKGTYIKKVSVSSTMGPGMVVDHHSLLEK